MSTRREKKIDIPFSYTVDVKAEIYNSAKELVYDNRHRPVRISDYDVIGRGIRSEFHGVRSYDEAYELLATGYQSVVGKLKEELKVRGNESPRFVFVNDIQGFLPVIPLALKGVPNCMIDTRIKPMKAKVIDVYYDMTANRDRDTEDFVRAGKLLLSAILGLEKQGYKINLYAIQSYWDCHNYAHRSIDILCVKVKSSNSPLDIKRMSFPLAHPAFFRVVGFDWQSKSPITRDIGYGRGRGIIHDFSQENCEKIIKTIFGNNAFYIAGAKLIDREYDTQTLKEALTNEKIA